MAVTIDKECRRLSRLSTDFDNFKVFYTFQNDTGKVVFASPFTTILDNNRFFILKNSIQKPLLKKFHYRPDYLSYEEYGNTVLWSFLLWINNVKCIEEFDISDVYIPSYGVFADLLQQASRISKVQDINSYLVSQPQKSLPKLYRKRPLVTDESSIEDNEVTNEDISNIPYIRQQFQLSSANIYYGFVDLAFNPIIETIKLRVNGQNLVPVYDYQYTIKKDSRGNEKRLTWKQEDCKGEGLTLVLQKDMVIEVQYVRK